MWIDPIIEEVRQARKAYAEQFNYDLDAICEDLRRQQEEEGRKIVSFPPKPARPIKRIARRQTQMQYPVVGKPTGVALRERNEDTTAQDDQDASV